MVSATHVTSPTASNAPNKPPQPAPNAPQITPSKTIHVSIQVPAPKLVIFVYITNIVNNVLQDIQLVLIIHQFVYLVMLVYVLVVRLVILVLV